MIKENIKNLEFYLDNGLNEVIEEKSQNHFSVQDRDRKTVKKEKAKTQNNFIKQVNSTSEAISNLAKKTKKDNENIVNSNFGEQKFVPLNDIVNEAKKLAKAANNLAELRKAVENFDGCGLKKMATNTVFCDGNPDSRIMVIGEAPGNHEDLQGIPFCGDSGKLLDDMFAAINLDRTKLYITNVIFWRPPGNRRPTEEELAICRPFVERHIQLVDPKIIILVGSTSMSAILDINDPVTGVRGRIIEFSAKFMQRKLDCFVIFHPSYLMRQSSKKRIAWRDLLEIEKVLKK